MSLGCTKIYPKIVCQNDPKSALKLILTYDRISLMEVNTDIFCGDAADVLQDIIKKDVFTL